MFLPDRPEPVAPQLTAIRSDGFAVRKFLSLRKLFVLIRLLFVNTGAWGHSKTDLVAVSTGDTLTDAIKSMVAG